MTIRLPRYPHSAAQPQLVGLAKGFCPPNAFTWNMTRTGSATLLPDTLYLRGKRVVQSRASPARNRSVPHLLDEYLVRRTRRISAASSSPSSPTPRSCHAIFFRRAKRISQPAGLAPDVAAAIEKRLARRIWRVCTMFDRWQLGFGCRETKWQASMKSNRSATRPGRASLCAAHGAAKLCEAFEDIPEANLFYMNLPYGEAGAYLWI